MSAFWRWMTMRVCLYLENIKKLKAEKEKLQYRLNMIEELTELHIIECHDSECVIIGIFNTNDYIRSYIGDIKLWNCVHCIKENTVYCINHALLHLNKDRCGDFICSECKYPFKIRSE